MTKKILVLSSSFRKGGNSDTLCDQFVKGAVEAGHQVEKIFINDKQIGYCHGCGVCNTTHKCVLHDDMAEILDKMIQADVIVMATPVYFYSMNGQMKTLIDRTVPRYRGQRLLLYCCRGRQQPCEYGKDAGNIPRLYRRLPARCA